MSMTTESINSRYTAEVLNIVATLKSCKVPMALRNSYKDGKRVSSEWLPNVCTKEDKFFRINGRIVTKGIALWAMQYGVAKWQEKGEAQ
jgi:hypothetical protein